MGATQAIDPAGPVYGARFRRNRTLALSAVLALLVCRIAASGEEPPPAGELRPYKQFTLEELMDVDVRAPTKIEQPIREAPTVGSVITREQIGNYGWLTLEEALLRQPGFAPSQDYERITVSSRGQYESWNNNHLRLLIDGVPDNNVTNGTAFVWETMPLSIVETVEIMRGPGSALYGSNATNGVIAVNTRKPADAGELQATADGGNAGTRALEVSGGRALPWLRFLAAYKYQGTDGNVYDSYDASRRAGPDGRFLKFQVNDAHSVHTGFLKADGQGPLAGLSLQANLAWWEFQTAQGWLYRIPDEPERAVNNRELVTLSYRPSPLIGDRLQLEFVADCQRTEKDYRIKLLPDSAVFAGTTYADGITEILDSKAMDYFARFQADYRLVAETRILFGVENLVYLTRGSTTHQSNIDMDRGGTLQPFPDGQLHDLGWASEAIADRPLENMGLFLQVSSGRVLRRLVSATAGVRYDFEYAKYLDLDQADKPLREKYLDQVSPRLGLVFFPHPDLTIKALAERAFRAPAPSELFSANSLLGFSNPGPLQPENMTAYTLAADLALIRHLNLRIDGFYQEFDNQIAYSGTKNYTSNVYSRSVNGVEAELLFDADLGAAWALSGFLNYTLAHQLDENVLEPTIAMSDRLTWAPEHVSNQGLVLARRGLSLSLQGHYQGTVYRRASDYLQADGTPTVFSAYRPRSLDPWFTTDAAVAYRFAHGLRLRIRGTNVFDARGYLMKPGNYPFDYRIEGARVLATVEYALSATGI